MLPSAGAVNLSSFILGSKIRNFGTHVWLWCGIVGLQTPLEKAWRCDMGDGFFPFFSLEITWQLKPCSICGAFRAERGNVEPSENPGFPGILFLLPLNKPGIPRIPLLSKSSPQASCAAIGGCLSHGSRSYGVKGTPRNWVCWN